MQTHLPAVVLLGFCLAGGSPPERETQRKWLVGQTPPELTAQKEHWLGRTPGTTLAELKGNVVWLQFNF